MEDNHLPSFRPFLLPTLAMLFFGWGGVALLLLYTEPLVWMRWSMFALLFVALTGTALPIVYFFHYRFPNDPPPNARVIVRQAQWLGVYGILLLWLRSGKLLSLWLTLGLAGGLLAIESLIRMRERSLWKPPIPDDE